MTSGGEIDGHVVRWVGVTPGRGKRMSMIMKMGK